VMWFCVLFLGMEKCVRGLRIKKRILIETLNYIIRDYNRWRERLPWANVVSMVEGEIERGRWWDRTF